MEISLQPRLRSRTSCRRPPILELVLATRRNGSTYLARLPSPDSCVRLSPAPPRLRSSRCPPDSCRSSRAGPACRLWSRKWNRDRSSIPDPARAPALPPDSALPVPPETGAPYGSLEPLPPTAPAESDSPWPHWLRQNCHRPTALSLAPAPLPRTAARTVQTTARTISIHETARAGKGVEWGENFCWHLVQEAMDRTRST